MHSLYGVINGCPNTYYIAVPLTTGKQCEACHLAVHTVLVGDTLSFKDVLHTILNNSDKANIQRQWTSLWDHCWLPDLPSVHMVGATTDYATVSSGVRCSLAAMPHVERRCCDHMCCKR